MFASLRDTLIYFDIEGAGLVPDGPRMRERPVAMIVHGGPGSDHTGFKPAMSPLTEQMQLVYFDHRGQGRSGRADLHADPARFTLDENVADMEALRIHLGLGPVVSIGTSYGGMVGMAHAARHPGAVSHLILIVTAAHGGFIPRAQQILRERGTPEQQRAGETLWAGEFRTEAELRRFFAVMGPLYARHRDATAGEDGRARTIHTPEPVNRAFGPHGFLRHFDLRPELARITVPTLIMTGRHDWICPVEFSEELHRLIPGSELLIFEDSSHSVRVDAPEAMLRAIRDFVGSGTST
jgi:proline iminopeptidase